MPGPSLLYLWKSQTPLERDPLEVFEFGYCTLSLKSGTKNLT